MQNNQRLHNKIHSITNNDQTHLIIMVSILSTILIFSCSEPSNITKFHANAQGIKPNNTKQMMDHSRVANLASIVAKKTGIPKNQVESVISRIDIAIINAKGEGVAKDVIDNFTYSSKQRNMDPASQVLYKITIDQLSGNKSRLNQTISLFVERLGNHTDIVQQLAHTSIDVIGDATLNQNIEYISSQIGSNTGSDPMAVKKLLYQLSIQISNNFNDTTMKNSLKTIASEVQKDPGGLASQSISRLVQSHFTNTDLIMKYAVLGHVGIPSAITGIALRTTGGYPMDLGIYQISNLIHNKYGIDYRAVQHILQLIFLMIGNTGGNTISNNTLTTLKYGMVNNSTDISQSLVHLTTYQIMGKSNLVYDDIVQIAQQVDNGRNIIDVIKEIIPSYPDNNPPCTRNSTSLGCPHMAHITHK